MDSRVRPWCSPLESIHSWIFFRAHGLPGFLVLGAVVLAVTGAERCTSTWDTSESDRFGSLVRDMCFRAGAELLRQGALLLIRRRRGATAVLPAGPVMALFPLVGIATAAAIIASQAPYQAAFSLDAGRRSARLRAASRHRAHSSHEMGQVYVPQVNWTLMVATRADRHRVQVVQCTAAGTVSPGR